MAEQQKYLDFGRMQLPYIHTGNTEGKSTLTTNKAYPWFSIEEVREWKSFNYDSMSSQFGRPLEETYLKADPMPDSPPNPAETEPMVKDRIYKYVTVRVNRMLQSSLDNKCMRSKLQSEAHSRISNRRWLSCSSDKRQVSTRREFH